MAVEDTGFLAMNIWATEETIGEKLNRYSTGYLKHREEKLVEVTESVYNKLVAGAYLDAKNTPNRSYWAEVIDLVDKELQITFEECQFIAKRIEKKIMCQDVQFLANEHDGNVRLILNW